MELNLGHEVSLKNKQKHNFETVKNILKLKNYFEIGKNKDLKLKNWFETESKNFETEGKRVCI